MGYYVYLYMYRNVLKKKIIFIKIVLEYFLDLKYLMILKVYFIFEREFLCFGRVDVFIYIMCFLLVVFNNV